MEKLLINTSLPVYKKIDILSLQMFSYFSFKSIWAAGLN